MSEKTIIHGSFSKFNIVSAIFAVLTIVSAFTTLYGLDHFYDPELFMWLIITGVCLLLTLFFWVLLNLCSLTVTDKRIYGKAAFGHRVNLPFDMISSVGISAFKGIAVATSSGRISFFCCKNNSEVYDAISELLLERQENKKTDSTIVQEIAQSSADELKKFKELLDSGVITQEEFDAKKKQLLGL